MNVLNLPGDASRAIWDGGHFYNTSVQAHFRELKLWAEMTRASCQKYSRDIWLCSSCSWTDE